MDDAFSKSPMCDKDDWVPCRPGTLPGPEMTLGERVVKRKSDIFSLSLIYLSGAVLAFTVFVYWKSTPERGSAYSPDQIPCADVRQHLCSYANMSISNCRLRASISQHLCRCPDCDLVYQGLIGNHNCNSVIAKLDATDLRQSLVK